MPFPDKHFKECPCLLHSGKLLPAARSFLLVFCFLIGYLNCGGWAVEPYPSGICSLLSRGGRCVFTKELISLPLNIVYCSAHGSDWQPSLPSARCVSAGCGSRMCCKLGIQVLLQLLTEAGMLQRGSLAVFSSINVVLLGIVVMRNY